MPRECCNPCLPTEELKPLTIRLHTCQELRSALASNVQQKQDLLNTVETMKAQLSMQTRLGGADSERLQGTEQQLADLHQELYHTKVLDCQAVCVVWCVGQHAPGTRVL